MSCPAVRAVYAKPRKACLIETTYEPAGNVGPDHVGLGPTHLDAVVEQPLRETIRLGVAPLSPAMRRNLIGRPSDERDHEGLGVLDHPVVLALGESPAGHQRVVAAVHAGCAR